MSRVNEIKRECLRMFRLEKRIRDNQILDQLDLSLYVGEVTGLAGDETSGVEAMCRILSGDAVPTGGKWFFMGKETMVFRRQDARKLGIYRIHAESRLLEGMNVAENLCLIRPKALVPQSEHRRVKKKNIELLAREYLEEWGGSVDPRKLPEELTGAEKLFLMMVKAVMCGARLLILDHVCGNLAGEDCLRLQRILERMKKKNMTILIAEKQPERMIRCSDRVVVMNQGGVTGDYYRGEFSSGIILSLLCTGSLQGNARDSKIPGQERPDKACAFLKPGKKSAVPIPLFPGSVVGILAQGLTWRNFWEHVSYDKADSKNHREGRIQTLLGEQQKFGLFHGFCPAENLNLRILCKMKGRLGLISSRLLEYSYQECYPGQSQGAWEKEEEMSTSAKLRLAVESCLRSRPELILMDRMGRNLDVRHLNELCGEISRLSEQEIFVILLNPCEPLIRRCCHSLWSIKGGEFCRYEKA